LTPPVSLFFLFGTMEAAMPHLEYTHLIRITLTLVLILVLIRRKVQVGPTLFICSAFLALVYWMPLKVLGPAVVEGLFGKYPAFQTLYILAAVLMVLMLGTIMGEHGFLKKMVRGIESMFGDPRWVIGGLPAMIGLLPMPGGALFTAPMVGETADKLGLNPDVKTYLNHHFRHVFEYTWPLYPGLIILSSIVDIPIRSLAIYNLPLTLAAIVGGIIFGLVPIKIAGNGRRQGGGFLAVIDALWPILFVVALVLLFNLDLLVCLFLLVLLLLTKFRPWYGFAFALIVNGVFRFALHSMSNEMLYIANIPVALIFLAMVILHPLYPRREFPSFLRRSIKGYMVAMVFGVMLFSSIIRASGAADGVAADIKQLGLPPIFVICLLPAILGYLTGITHSFVAGSFPILLPFIPEGPDGFKVISLAYACGFLGVLISPVHFCLILTVEYFKSDLMRVVRLLLPPMAVILAVALLRYYL
jgi:hypothetical protein